MSKINLTVQSDRMFGKYLPSVYIKRIVVDYDTTDAGESVTANTVFNVEMNINFTKDSSSGGEISLEELKHWMEKYLDGLYLYTFLSPHTLINNSLKQNSLNLLDLFEAYDTPTAETFSSNHYLFGPVKERMMEAWTRKEIDYFGAGGGTTGGVESMPDGFYPEDGVGFAGDGLTGLYYFSTPGTMTNSTNTAGSVFNKLFYGNRPGGPWTSSYSDLPTYIYYATGTPLEMSDPYFRSTGGPSLLGFAMAGMDAASEDTALDGKWETSAVPDGMSFMNKHIATFLEEVIEDSEDVFNKMQSKMKLTELLTAGGVGDDAELIMREVYDENGKEIIQITGINLQLSYDNDATPLTLSRIPDMLVIATIGLDVNEGGALFGSKGIGRDTAPRGIFNNYFGGITYESALKYGSIDDSFTEIFVNEEGIPYDGIPIQALNGKYYAEEPVNRGEIIANLENIVKKYKSKLGWDPNLKNNADNLQYILSRYSNSTNLFSELKRFQKTYTLKSQATASGKLYAEIVNAMVVYSKKVMTQEVLNKKLILNAIVSDLRPTKFVKDSYAAPYKFSSPPATGEMGTTTITVTVLGLAGYGGLDINGDGDYDDDGDIPPLPGTPDETFTQEMVGVLSCIAEEVSDNYIPRKWISISRATKVANQDYLPEGIGGTTEGQTDYEQLLGDVQREIDAAEEAMPEGTSMYAPYWENLAETTVDDILFSDPEREVISTIFGSRDITEGNLLCRNTGHFFFDWEKALHQQSQAAKVVRLSALHRFLGIAVPYEYFKVSTVRMIRNEAPLARDTTTGELNAGLGMRMWAVQAMTMDTSLDYPKTLQSVYYGQTNFTSDPDGVGILNLDDLQRNGIGFPEVQVYTSNMSSYSKSRSALRFVNFDVAGSSYNHRLEGYGHFTPYGDDTALQKGYKIRDGYRLMCFRFKDWMGDDIAYYNTIYGEDDVRADELISQNNYEDPCSQYIMHVIVEDKTMAFIVEQVYSLVMSVYQDLKDYVLYAEELCSYNNITNQFNKFFVDAINARYPNPQDKAWIKAAFVINSFRATFFDEFADENTGQEETIIKASVDLVNKMSPERGTLENLRAFLTEYRRFIMFFNPFHIDEEVPISAVPTPHIYDRILEISDSEHLRDEGRLPSADDLAFFSKEHHFVNSISIDQPIYGEQFLDAYKEEDITLDVASYVPKMYVPNPPTSLWAVEDRTTTLDERFHYYHIRNLLIKNEEESTLQPSAVSSFGSPADRLIYAKSVMLRIGNYITAGGAYVGSDSFEYHGSFDATATDSASPGATEFGGLEISLAKDRNRTGLTAQNLLYVIKNQIMPKLEHCDNVAYLLGYNHYYLGSAGEFVGGDDVMTLDEVIASAETDSSGYSAYEAVTGDRERSEADVRVMQENQYLELRYAIKIINNALLDIIRGSNREIAFWPGRSAVYDPLPVGEARTFAVFRNLLDAENPIGTDYNQLFNEGVLDTDKLNDMYDDYPVPEDVIELPAGIDTDWVTGDSGTGWVTS